MLKQNGAKRRNAEDNEEEQPSHKQQRHPMQQQPNGLHPSKKITKSIRGKNRVYHYLATVKSVKKLEDLALKVIAGQDILLIQVRYIYGFGTTFCIPDTCSSRKCRSKKIMGAHCT
jgi:hypothetical protein